VSDHQQPCVHASSVDSLKAQAADLFTLLRELTSRVEENTTFLFGPERNGGGWVKVHERAHEEEAVELKQVLEVLRAGQVTQTGQSNDLAQKVAKLCDKKAGLREIVKMTLPAIVTAAAAVVAVVLK
jgi:hypothetical protein